MSPELVLINTNLRPTHEADDFYIVLPAAEANMGLMFTGYGCGTRGITYKLLPERDVRIEIDEFSKFLEVDDVKKNILDKIPTDDGTIIGLSTWTMSSSLMYEMADYLKKCFPDTIVVGGGPHFNISLETKEEFNQSSLDAYIVGGSQSLIDFYDDIKSGKIIWYDNYFTGVLPDGFYCRSGDTVEGKGYGRFPEIDLKDVSEIIISMIDIDGVDYVSFHLPTTNHCPNNCDYCSSPKGDMGDIEFISGFANKTLSDIESNDEVKGKRRFISFSGNNPFLEENRQKTEALLSRIDYSRDDMISFCIDPYLLVGKDYDSLLDTLLHIDADIACFLGRDFIGDSAEKYGRKWYGSIRDGAMRDAEIDAVVRFAKDLDKSKIQAMIHLSYIVSPHDDASAFNDLYSELIHLSDLNQGFSATKIDFSVNILTPFPGTRIREDNFQQIGSQPFSFYNSNTNLWKDAPLLDHMEKALSIASLLSGDLFGYGSDRDSNNLLKATSVLYSYMMRNKEFKPEIKVSDLDMFKQLHLETVDKIMV